MPVYFDFSSLLAIATVIAGLIWVSDVCFFRKARKDKPEPKLVEYARSFFPILLFVCVLRSFIVEPFRIPSGSMKPTLLEGDFILVNKYTYGIRLPVFGTTIIHGSQPKMGDILVFRYPKDTSVDFIKRVIGVPGDKISYKDKIVYVNGKPLSQEFLGVVNDSNRFGQREPVRQMKEALGQKTHSLFIHPNEGIQSMAEVTVPEGMYFVMGDNRDNSEDSRVWGFVPQDLILGKAFFIWLSWDSAAMDVRWKRMGHSIE